MSVSSHLQIPLHEYDARIRTFIPGYDAMLDAGAGALRVLARRPVILDLGTGTGAFAARCLGVVPSASLIAIDEDAGILEMARRRLERARRRVDLRLDNFARATLPRADAVIASLALHHVKRVPAKRALYARIARALRSGGVLVSGDCFPPVDPRQRRAAFDDWRAHLRASYTARETQTYFASWAKEDRYFTLDEEMAMMRGAGLRPDILWRAGAMGVIAARKGSGRS